MEEEKKHESKDRISEIKTFCQLRKLLNEQQIETFCQLFDQDTNYNVDTLRDEICQVFGQNDESGNLTIYKMLTDQLCLLAPARQRIYDRLLREYFHVIDFTVDNMINLSKTFIIQLKMDDIVDIETFASIVRNNNLDGKKFMSLKNSREY
eukprot:103582_1